MEQLIEIAQSANTTWNAAFNSGNIQQLGSLYSERATLSPGNGTTLVGRNEIEALFKSFIDAGVHDHTLATLEVGGDANTIYQVARWGAKGAPSNGSTPAFGGITMNVLKKDASGNWVTHAHVWNVSQ